MAAVEEKVILKANNILKLCLVLAGILKLFVYYTQTAHELSQARLRRHIVVLARHATFPQKVLTAKLTETSYI